VFVICNFDKVFFFPVSFIADTEVKTDCLIKTLNTNTRFIPQAYLQKVKDDLFVGLVSQRDQE